MSRAQAVAVDEDLLCPITHCLMKDPVEAADGKTYCKSAITEWITKCKKAKRPVTSPMTNLPMGESLKPNTTMTAKLVAFLVKFADKLEADEAAEDEARHMLSSAIFHDLDRLSSHDLMKKLNLCSPKFIVLGNESSGKSTVLERLIGFPIFPKNKQLCTRMPIRVHLRRGPATIPEVAIRRRDGDGAIVSGSEEMGTLETLCDIVLKKMMETITAQKREVVDNFEIVISIQVPYCPNLEIIDLPGLVAATDSGKEDLATVTKSLAQRVIEEEKELSTFLLVVPATGAANLSLAMSLIQSAKVENKTLGIFTKMDLLKAHDDDTTEADMIVDAVTGTAVGSIKLPHGWLMCSNRGPAVRKSTAPLSKAPSESHRLYCMDVQEAKLIQDLELDTTDKTCFPRVGMTNIRLRVRDFFEDFLVNDWVPKIRAHLISHFDEQSKHCTELGVPMPNDIAYEPFVTTLKVILPIVYPEYDMELLATQTGEEFLKLLLHRVRAVFAHGSKDWLGVNGLGPFWALVEEFKTHVPLTATAWQQSSYFLRGSGAARDEKAWVVERMRKSMEYLGLQSRSALPKKLVEALVAQPPVTTPGGVMQRVGKFLPFMKNFSAQTDDDQAAVTKLIRFPHRMEAFQKHLAQCFHQGTAEFERKMALMIADQGDRCVHVVFTKGTTCVANVAYRPSAEAIGDIPHDIMQLWLECILEGVETHTQNWTIPPTSEAGESCKAKRMEYLTEELKVAEVLQALHTLKLRAEDKKITPPTGPKTP